MMVTSFTISFLKHDYQDSYLTSTHFGIGLVSLNVFGKDKIKNFANQYFKSTTLVLFDFLDNLQIL